MPPPSYPGDRSPDAARPDPRRGAAGNATHRSLTRANTAVAVVIVAVLGLAVAATWQSLRATRLQALAEAQTRRAGAAEDAARMELWRALLAESRSIRQGQTLDRRERALGTLGRAAAISATPDLRAEAVAALALPSHRLEAVFAPGAGLRAYEFDPSLTTCALGWDDGGVSIVRLSDGSLLRRIQPDADSPLAGQGAALLMAFDGTGRLLSVRHAGGALAVWETETGRLVMAHDADQPRRPASRGRFSDDGRFVMGPVFEPDGMGVLEVATGRMVAHLPDFGSFHHLAPRPGHRQVAAYDGTRVWLVDWESGRRIREFPFPAGVRWLEWSPDGTRLAVAGNAPAVHVWEVGTGRLIELQGHRDDVLHAAFSNDGGLLATSPMDGGSRIWDLSDGRLLTVTSDRRLIRWGPDGRTGWSAPGHVLEVRREEPSPVYRELPPVPGEPPPDGYPDVRGDGRLALAAVEGSGLQIWNLDSGTPATVLPLPGLQAAQFDPVAARLLVIRGQRVEAVAFDEGAAGPRLGEVFPVVGVPGRTLDRVTCSADGRARAYVELLTGTVWVERLVAGGGVVEIRGLSHSSVRYDVGSPWGTGALALSPDGRWLVCGADGGQGVRVHDSTTGEPVASLDPGTGGVQFSPDGRWLVVSGPDACRLFRTDDWTPVWTHPGGGRSRPGPAAVSPDGSLVAYAGAPRRLGLIDTGTGREVVRMESPSGAPMAALRWVPGTGGLLAMTSRGRLELWRPDAIRSELSRMGLDWSVADPAPTGIGDPLPAPMPRSARGIALGLFVTAGAAAVVALGALGRHRRLVDEHARTQALAFERERELEVEREVGRLKDRFVAIVSHEFRTPLGIIMSAVELLRNYADRLTGPRRDELHGDIFHATRRMAGMMEQVLVLGRVDGGRVATHPAPLDLAGIAERLADECRSATAGRCPVKVVTVGDLSGAVGDEALLDHVFSNLLANAVKYSPPGEAVRIEVHRDSRWAVFTIADRGIGIPPDELPRLFEAFHRASNVGDTPGTGLGLLIVKRCVDLLGGEISIGPGPGRGTVVVVRLPLFER